MAIRPSRLGVFAFVRPLARIEQVFFGLVFVLVYIFVATLAFKPELP